jgi:uncharacterized protein YraI
MGLHVRLSSAGWVAGAWLSPQEEVGPGVAGARSSRAAGIWTVGVTTNQQVATNEKHEDKEQQRTRNMMKMGKTNKQTKFSKGKIDIIS